MRAFLPPSAAGRSATSANESFKAWVMAWQLSKKTGVRGAGPKCRMLQELSGVVESVSTLTVISPGDHVFDMLGLPCPINHKELLYGHRVAIHLTDGPVNLLDNQPDIPSTVEELSAVVVGIQGDKTTAG